MQQTNEQHNDASAFTAISLQNGSANNARNCNKYPGQPQDHQNPIGEEGRLKHVTILRSEIQEANDGQGASLLGWVSCYGPGG